MPTSICLIGAGRIGRIHAENVHWTPDAELRYVVDADEDSASDLAGRFDAECVSLDIALGDAETRGVIIATPTDTHLELIERAAAAGKAIFCEKPLDLDADRARRCVSAAAAAGVPLFVGFNRRYDPAFARIRTDLHAGAIGSMEALTIISRDPAPPPIDYVRRSGGLFRDMTIHDLDLARWLLPEEPETVYAVGACLVEPAIGDVDDIDSATVVLATKTGIQCQIVNSRRCSYGYDQRIEVFASAGMLRAENESPTRVELATRSGFEREPALPFFLERYAQAYRLQIQDFVAALEGRPHGLADGTDGLAALRLADAADESRRAGQPVRLGGLK